MNKVLFLIDTLEVGGAETSILEIASRLEAWTPIVVSIYPGETLKPKFEEANIKLYSLNVQGKFGFKEAINKIANIIEIEKPKVIHATLFKAEQFSRWLGPKYNIPVINSFVNDSYSKERYALLNYRQKIALNIYKFIDKVTSYRVNKFMSITQAIVLNNSMALKVNPDKVEVIHRGRNIESFRAKVKQEEIVALQKEFGNGIIILTVSRLLLRKGYREAIKAMAKVILKKPDVKYLIAGEGHDRQKFEKLIVDLGMEKNIFLLGNRSDIPSLLAFSEIFLFPSHYEGQGGALVEAMILGKPIIASNIPVIEESVKHKHSALLFKLRDIDDMYRSIIWALTYPEKMKEFGNNAQASAEKRFNIEKVAKQHERLYDNI